MVYTSCNWNSYKFQLSLHINSPTKGDDLRTAKDQSWHLNMPIIKINAIKSSLLSKMQDQLIVLFI